MNKILLIIISYFLSSFYVYATNDDEPTIGSTALASYQNVVKGQFPAVIIRREPFVFDDIQPAHFATGLRLWTQQKENFEYFVFKQFTPMSKRFRETLEFQGNLESMASSGQLCVSILCRYEGIIPGINLEFKVKPNMYASYQVYYAFNQALFEIHDLILSLENRALYLRSDLMKLSNVFEDTLCFFTQVEAMAKKLFGVHSNSLSIDDAKSFSPVYRPANDITKEIERYTKYVKHRYDGKIGIYEYINFYSKMYHVLFQNRLFTIQAHLKESEDQDTIKLLNRMKPEGALTEAYELFKYTLPAFETIKKFAASADKSGSSIPAIKKKRKKTNRRTKANPSLMDKGNKNLKYKKKAPIKHSKSRKKILKRHSHQLLMR